MVKAVVKRALKDNDHGRDREWWLAQSPQARLAEVERLRKVWYGDISGFERVARIIPLSLISVSAILICHLRTFLFQTRLYSWEIHRIALIY